LTDEERKKSIKMPPIVGDSRDLKSEIKELIDGNKIMIFSKTTCPYCTKVKELFKSLGLEVHALELDKIDNGADIQQTLAEMSGQKTVPSVYIGGQHIGGCDSTLKLHTENKLLPMIHGELYEPAYDYDLIVIGGGSGGLSAAKEAATLGMKVACLDFVKPSPQGTTWGLGGTCVNVGCIPKKLMHQAALIGHTLEDAKHYGWQIQDGVGHKWETMKDAIQEHIQSLNWGYKVQLRSKKVTYINAYAKFEDQHHISCTDAKGNEKKLSAKYFIVATGGRPKYPTDVEGCPQHVISSDDLFSLPRCPGKTLVIGASYVSLECAGFLQGIGLDVTIMVRSILLRGFDQQMAELVGAYMKNHGVKFIRPCIPTKIEKISEGGENELPVFRVTAVMQESKEEITGEYNCVLMAVGREPCTKDLALDKVGVKLTKAGKVLCEDDESTSCHNIFAVGDMVEGRPELTPVAVQSGRLLARRLFAGETLKTDYSNIPTTVFTPLEYGAVGLTEEQAIEKYGAEDLTVYHSNFTPLEWAVPHRESNACYAKLLCVRSLQERVVGLHVLGPNAGEVTQGWTLGIKLHATKSDFDNSIGIHPTCSEIFTTLAISKDSGAPVLATGC